MYGRLLSKENILILVLQAILCLIAFNKFFVHPTDVMFMDLFDGIKNYFTFQSYLQQDPSVGLALVQGHAYPFGDYLFYADLTPTIAVPLRFFSIYIYDISDYAIPIFNFIIILLHWITALVVYKLVKHFVKTPWLAVLLGISLTWIHPQLPRLGNGHFNLSISLFIVLSLLFLVHIYKGYQKDPAQYFSQHKGKLGALLATFYLASFTHLYFLPILGLTIGFFAFFQALELKFYKKQSWSISLKPLVVLGGVCVLGLVLVMGTIILVDNYYALRAVGNSAYGFTEWKLSLASLFTAREFNYLQYFFSYAEPNTIHYESNLYLGAFTLYGLTGLLLLRLFGKSLYIPVSQVFSEKKYLWCFLGMAFLCFFVAMGEKYYFLDSQYYYNNYLNPFLYLRKVVSRIEQFRCLARFFWPAFWVFSLAVAACVDYYYRNHTNQWIKAGIIGLALVAVSDTKDVISFQNRLYQKNYFAKDWATTGYEELSAINFSNYQALLPLPYFHSSTEIENLILDGGAYYNREIQLISLLADLPMMSIQSSRVPVSHARHLFSLFTPPYPDQELLDALGEEPILVLYHKPFHEQMEQYGEISIPTQSPVKEVLLNGKFLPDYYKMKKLGEGNTFIVYEWNPKATSDANVTTQIQTWDMEANTASTPMTRVDSSTKNYLQTFTHLDPLTTDKARSGKQSTLVNPQHSKALSYQIHQLVPGTSIQASVWRHKSASYGAIVAEGMDYQEIQETVLQEEGDWQQIQASFWIPEDYQGTSLSIYYWNLTPNTVYLDDWELTVYTPKK